MANGLKNTTPKVYGSPAFRGASGERFLSRGLRNWSGSFATNVVLLGIGTVTGVLTARLLGPEGRGELAKIIFWGSYVATLAACGIPAALTQAISRHPEDRGAPANAAALSLALALSGAIGFAALGPGLLGADAVDAAAVLFVALYLPGNALALALGSIDRGDQNFFRYNLVRVGPQSIYLVGVLLLWMTGRMAVMPLAYSILAGTWVTAAVRAVTLRGRVAWELSADRIKQLFRSGLTFHAGNLSETFFGRADRFALATWFSDAQFGFYAAALTLGGAGIGKVSGATNAILLPKLASAVTRDERKRTLRNALTANLAVAGMLNLIVAASAPLLVPWLFGAEFAPAAPLAVVVCLAEIPASYCRVASLGLRAMDDWSPGLSSQGLGFVVFAGVAILGSASRLGVLGVALATLAAQTAAMAYLIRRIRQRLGLSAWECLLPPAGLLHSLSRQTIEAVRRQPAS